MKKTLITLLVLGGMAMAASEQTLYSIKNNTVKNDTTSKQSPTATVDESLNDITGELLTLTSSVVANWPLSSGNVPGSLSGVAGIRNNNGQSGFTDAYSLSFTPGLIEENYTITLTGITMDLFAINAGATPQGTTNNTFELAWKLIEGDTTLASGTQSATALATSGGNNTTDLYTQGANKAVFTFSTLDSEGQGITLSAGQEYKFTFDVLSIKNSNNAKTTSYSAVGNIALKGTVDTVPEPATATLSLLALAGLASRRRRH